MAYNVVYAAAAYNGGNSAKRMRLSEDQPKPSRVLHLRGLPPDTTEAEIFQLTQLFGSVTNIILTRSKNQALVEMSDVNTAQLMVDYYRNVPARIRNQMVHVQYSVHDVLKVDQSSQSCEPALDGDGQHAILRVIVDNMLYPVTLDTLHALFSKYGQVLRIITFSKNNSFQALVEFSDGQSAQTAKMSLNGQNVYNGCCSLHIDFSKLKRLSVRYNNDKSRDYTNNQLGSDEPGMQPPGSGSHHQQQHGPPAIMHYDGSAEGPGGSGDGPIPAGPAGPGVWGPYPHNQGAFGVHMGGPNMGGMEASGNSIFGCYPGPMTYGFTAGMPGGTFGTMQMPQFFNPAMNSAMQGPGGHYQRQHQQRRQAPVPAGTGAVLLVSNLETEKVTPDALFTLFGVYGDVLRVKILFNKKDTAMIQFIDASQAQRALSNLDYVRLFGKQMKVSASKHAVVQMPKEGTPDAHLTQDYSTSPLHRFHNPNSKNHLHIAPPSETLHLSNLPPQATEEFLRSMFSQFGTVAGFKFFEKDAKMALIQMSTTDEAVDALTLLHNADLGSNARLRVTFTKSTIEGAGTKH